MRATALARARRHAAFAFSLVLSPSLPALRAKLESTGALRRLRARLRADVTLALEAEQQARTLFNALVSSRSSHSGASSRRPLTL